MKKGMIFLIQIQPYTPHSAESLSPAKACVATCAATVTRILLQQSRGGVIHLLTGMASSCSSSFHQKPPQCHRIKMASQIPPSFVLSTQCLPPSVPLSFLLIFLLLAPRVRPIHPRQGRRPPSLPHPATRGGSSRLTPSCSEDGRGR